MKSIVTIRARYGEFDSLCREVQSCVRCSRMADSTRVLSRAAGHLGSRIMFVGEAPGRLGADSSEIPFHGDVAGHNFERLLASAGLSRASVFITNAVLCNPKDPRGNNSPPNALEVDNCSEYLRRQIDLVNPGIVVTLGASALRAASIIESHALTLATSVRSAKQWYGRVLIPLYHPGQRAMIHRSFANQQSDYQFVAEQAKRTGLFPRKSVGKTKADIAIVAGAIVAMYPGISYFALHKLFYLFELAHVRKHGAQLTDAFFIRQKDGPYCVDLHLAKLRRALPQLVTVGNKGLRISSQTHNDLFGDAEIDAPAENNTIREMVRETLMKYRELGDEQLKTRVYLSAPMREILKQEKRIGSGLYNSPIDLITASGGRLRDRQET